MSKTVPAPHVLAATAAAAQAKPADLRTAPPMLARHVQAAIGGGGLQPSAAVAQLAERRSGGGKTRRRRPRRSSSAPYKKANRTELSEGFDRFQAQISSDSGDGTRATQVVLSVDGDRYTGSSGAGHAEMNALNKCLKAGNSLATIKSAQAKTVQCEAKPCCYRCSIILGLLGFTALNNETKKSKSGMGQTQWVLQEPLKGAVRAAYGHDLVPLLSNYPNVDKL